MPQRDVLAELWSLWRFTKRLCFKLAHSVSSTVAEATRSATGRDWVVSFGPVTGKTGEVVPIVIDPQCVFRGEKLVAMDSAAGRGSRINQILVGQKLQTSGTGTLTAFFSPSVVSGNGTQLDVCHLGGKITVIVEFLEDCVFDASLFGKAFLP
jgi:hypothetical protein